MRVALVQLGYGDDESVPHRIARVADLVRAQVGHDLVVLPELWAPGGFAYRQWAERGEPVEGPTATAMATAASDAGVVLHAGSIIEVAGRGDHPGAEGRGRWNTSLVFGPDGARIATYRKVHRFGFGVGEPALLEAGTEVVTADVPRPATGGADVRLGLATCYDLRFPELFRQLLDAGAEVIVLPAAWPAARVAHWSLLALARAVENQSFVLACNTAGTHSRHRMGGRSVVVDPGGEVLAEAGDDERVLSVDLDLTALSRLRASFPVLADRRL